MRTHFQPKLLVAGLAFLLGATACKFREADDFNAEAAGLVCKFNRLCSAEPVSDDLFEYAEGEACYDDFLEKHLPCPTHCDYKPSKARKCIRKLEDMVDSCDIRAEDLAHCQDVYDCKKTGDAQLIDECGFEYSPGTCLCSEDPDAPAHSALLALLALVGWRRRRAPSRPNSAP